MMRPVFAALALLVAFVPPAAAGNQEHRPSLRASHQIQAILDSVSVPRIHAYLDTLQGFTYRHTLDDTVSQTTGIGAARRWVHRMFEEFSAASGGRLQVQYFDFVATICGITRLHRNVLAILPGTLTPDRYFVVSGHLDTRGDPVGACVHNIFSPGANDDASGTAVSLELARVMSRYQFDASLIFMAVVGEDQGLYGSEAYAAWARANGMRIDGMITNDVVGNIVGQGGIVDSTSVRHFSSNAELTPHRGMARYMKLKSEFYYPEMTINLIPAVDRPGRGGDHQSFQNHGYTAVRFTEPNENLNHQHTATDIVANMSPPYVGRITRVNASGLASLAWAPVSPAAPVLIDPGTGTSLLVQWTNTQTEPDFAGFRVALRDSGALFYSMILDAGNATQATVTGLTPGVRVYLSLSAYDTAGNESLFSPEVGALPAVAPTAPANVASTSHTNRVSLAWSPNPQLDVVRYRIYRGPGRTSGFLLYDSVAVPVTTFDDFSLPPHTRLFYHVRAVDTDGNESAPSLAVAGQLVTHDRGVLVVDGTRDGGGGPLAPTDSVVDAYYAQILAGFTVGDEWDVADSLVASVRITDADMAPFSTVVWHHDVRGSQAIYNDTTALRKYLQQGGRVLFSGWRLSNALHISGGAGVTNFPPGTFVPLFLKVDSMATTPPIGPEFIAAAPAIPGYAVVTVDSPKIPVYSGTLVNTDVVLLPFSSPSTQIMFTHQSRNPGSQYQGKPVGWRYLGTDFTLTVFDFPLYYMREDEARAALRQALIDMGEMTVSVRESDGVVPEDFALDQNYPNPFNPSTIISYSLPGTAFHQVRVRVYDILGRQVATLVDERQGPGRYRITFDGGRIASGVYYYRMEAGTFLSARKMMVVK